ncbi:MAG: S-layer family protein, partial [Proteobacteria bacterium]|nr:S-layer family protein [Pseudomonadota bacterium]
AALTLKDVDFELGAAGINLNNITNTPQAGNLIVHVNGLLNQSFTTSQALHIGGTSDFSSGFNTVILANSHNGFTGAVSLNNVGEVSLVDSIALLLGTSSTIGNFSATAGGTGISQVGGSTLTIGNTMTSILGVTSPNADIILANTGNNLGKNIDLSSNGTPADIRDVNLDNNNTAATVPNFTALTNLRNLTLTFESNSMVFGSSVILNDGGSFNLFSPNNIDFGSGLNFIAGTSTATGTNLTVTGGSINATATNGSILGSSTLQSGAATLNDTVGTTGGIDTVTSGSINLSAPSGTVSTTFGLISGNALLNGTGNSTNNITSGGFSLSQSPDLSLTSIITGDAAFQGTSITAGSVNTITSGNLSFTSTTGNITGNLLQTGRAILTGSLTNDTTTQLNSGSITLNAGGSTGNIGIGFTGNPALITGNTINSTGTSTGVAVSAGNLTLTSAGEIDNQTLGTALAVQLGQIIGAATQSSSTLNITTTGSSGNAYISANTPVILGLSNISQLLNLTANGSITQTGTLTIGGTSSFTAGAHPITLNDTNNSFTGAVSFSNSGTNDVSVVDSIALLLGTSSIGQNFSATAGGSISQDIASTLSVSGNTTLGVSLPSSDILLANTGNDFAGTISFSGTAPAALSNIRDVNLDNADASATVPDFTGLTNLRNLTLNFENAGMTIGALITLTNGGSFNLTANNDVNVNANLIAGDNIVPLGNNITVQGGNVSVTSNTGNINGSVTLQTGSATLTDSAGGAGTDTVTSGGLTLSAPLGTISNTFSIILGNATLNGVGATINNITSGSLTLTDPGANPFTSGNATFNAVGTTGTNTITSGNINLSGSPASGAAVFTTGNALLSGTIAGGTTNINSGNITVSSTGGIGLSANPAIAIGTASNTTGTSTGVITTSGNISLIAAGEINNGTLSTPIKIKFGTAAGGATNNSGTLAVTTTGASGNAYIDTTAALAPIQLATSSISQLFSLTTAGSILQVPATTLSVGGNTTFGISVPSSDIILGNTGNDFAGTISFSGTTPAALANIRDINLDNADASATVPDFTGLTNLRNLTLTFENNSMTFTSGVTLHKDGSFNLFNTSNTANKDIDFGTGFNFIAGTNIVTGTNQTVTGGSIIASSTNGNILGFSTLQSGAATLNDTAAQTGGTDTVTSGSITLSAPSGTVSTSLGLSFGNALLNGTGNSTNNVTSGGYSLSQNPALVLSPIATGSATFAGTNITANSVNTITSGDISFTSTSGNITGSSLQTGNVSISGTLPSNTTTQLNSGSISLNAGVATGGIGIGLSGNPALITGNATNSTTTAAGVTINAGNLTLISAGEIDNGNTGSANPLLVQLGGATGPGTQNGGTLAITTTTGTGNAYIDTTAAVAPVQLATSSISQIFNLTTAGNIFQAPTATLSVGGTSNFNAGNHSITLTNTGNSFTDDVSLNTTGATHDAALTAGPTINLGTSNVGRNMIVTSTAGNINDPNAHTVTATGLALNAQTGIGTVGPILSAVTNLAAQNFAGSIFISNISPTLNITTVAALTGISTIDSSDINLNQTGNLNILSPVSTGADLDVALNSNTSGSIFINVTSGNLTSTAGNTITTGDATTTTGTGTNSATSGNIFLSTITSGNISLGDIVTTGVAFTAGNASNNDTATSGNISISSAGSISGTGALSTGNATLSGTSTGSATSGSISLNAGTTIGLSANPALIIGTPTSVINATATAGNINLSSVNEIDNGTAATPLKLQFAIPSGATTNNFGTLAISTTGASGNAYIDTTAAATPIQLAASNISQFLNLTTTGDITQTGSFTISGGNTKTSSFNAGAHAITLTNASNNITTDVSLNNFGANNASIFDLSALTFDNSSIGGSLTATTNNNAITQKSGSILTVNGSGTSTFNSGSASITLANTGNIFTGPLALTTTGANDANIFDSIALSFDTSSIGGNLTATAGGNISQVLASTLSVGGNTILGSSVAASDILLGNTGNNFAGTISFSGTAPAVLADIRDVNLDNANAGATLPSFAGLSNLRNLTLNFENAAIAFPAITLHAGGNLIATANGAITQSGALTVPGISSFTSGANPINLNSANSFTGPVTFTNSGANDVSVVDSIALLLGTSTIGQNFSATAGGTGISQSGGTTLTIG